MRAAGILILLTSLVAAEEEPPKKDARSLTFDEAIELGLAYNLGLRTARFDALVARLQIEREDSAWDWALDSEFGMGESLTPSRSTLAGADVVDTDTANFALGLTKTFRAGPTLELRWRNDRVFSNSSFNTINRPKYSAISSPTRPRRCAPSDAR